MIQSNEEDKYYEIIDSSGYHLIVFGEVGEQWTDEVLNVFEVAAANRRSRLQLH